MQDDEYDDGRFQWRYDKAAKNLAKHDVSFEQARGVFDDIEAMDDPDPDPDEPRWVRIGMVGLSILAVIYTERNGRTRIISARKAERYEQKNYARQKR